MMLTKKDKKELVELLKTIDINEKYASQDGKKRKWFRFGAYDALREATEMIEQIQEKKSESVSRSKK